MKTEINILENVKLKSPVFIEGLAGIGNVGRVAASYMVSELKMKKFAEMTSEYFLPLVVLHPDSVVQGLKIEFFYYKGRQDIIVMTGDSQSVSPEGHYHISEKIMEFAKKLGVGQIITLGGFAVEEDDAPDVIAAVNSKKLISKYKKYIDFEKEHPIGTIVGASGLLLEMAKKHNIDGLCLMGKTGPTPLLTDPKAADDLLKIIKQVTGVEFDLKKLEKTIVEMEHKIKKTADIYKKIMEQQMHQADSVKYIG
jgi:hypothetical protein